MTENYLQEEKVTEEKIYDVGSFFMLYKNEDEDFVRQFVVDLTSLNEQAKTENFSKEVYVGILSGFQTAVQIMLSNYNIVARKELVNSAAASEQYIKSFEQAVEQEELRQEEEQKQVTLAMQNETQKVSE